jgi:hypothetical protein
MLLSSFAGRHAGASFIVAGCGPSLLDLASPGLALLDLRTAAVIVGVNDACRHVRCDYLVTQDELAAFAIERRQAIADADVRAVFAPWGRDLGALAAPLVRYALLPQGAIACTPEALPCADNTAVVAVALAVLLGAKRIGLLGVDFTPPHFHADKLGPVDSQFGRWHARLVARGIGLVNLGARTRLRSVPAATLADWLTATDRGRRT